jgi:hypothetical protein
MSASHQFSTQLRLAPYGLLNALVALTILFSVLIHAQVATLAAIGSQAPMEGLTA